MRADITDYSRLFLDDLALSDLGDAQMREIKAIASGCCSCRHRQRHR